MTLQVPENDERELFAAAHQLPADQRVEYLNRACNGDTAMIRRIGFLLDASETQDQLFQSPRLATTLGHQEQGFGDLAGREIGRYKLLERIGEGGMAVVYMAEQRQPVHRKVAVKLIKPGMDTESVVARFEAERQALARMDHPFIAKIFDGGATEQGRPYFVMELVRGVPITQFCDENRLSTHSRLDLFVNVCQAIQHAHQKGIIHRDLKPSNILVTLADGQPIPKVIDFGIAKATHQPLTDKTLFTRFQYFVGTPASMSPEQAQMGALDIDTRTDIYALGALLYELLSGRTPFDPDELSNPEQCRRTILEKEPSPPSTRIASITGEDRNAMALLRREEPNQLAQVLRSDLDWITMKCLDKDRTRRYDTAAALAQDINRYLNNEPVEARPPSRLYRAQKFVRRNRIAVAVAGVLLVAGILSAWQAVRATRAVGEQNRLRGEIEVALAEEEQQRQRAETERMAALRRAYSSDMTLVHLALQNNNYGRVVDLLGRYETTPTLRQLRNWEWRYFWSQTRSEAAYELPQQSSAIFSLELSGDGRLLVTSDMRGTIKLWDLDKAVELLKISHAGPQRAAFALSHDGRRLAAVSTVVAENDDNATVINIWSVPRREIESTIAISGWPSAIVFMPDDSSLLILDRRQSVSQIEIPRSLGFQAVKDSSTQAGSLAHVPLKRLLPPSESRIWNQGFAVFSPDRSRLARVENSRVRVWNLESGDLIAEMEGHRNETWSMAFSSDGDTFAVGPSSAASSTAIKLYSLSSGDEVGELTGHESWVPDLKFTAGGRRIVSAGADQTVRIWDVRSAKQQSVLHGHLTEIYRLEATADGSRIVSGAKDGSLLVWDAKRKKQLARFETIPIPVKQIEFIPGGDEFLAVDPDGFVTLWDSSTLQPLSSIGFQPVKDSSTQAGSLGYVEKLFVSSSPVRVFANTRHGNVEVLDWATRQPITDWNTEAAEDSPAIVGIADQSRQLLLRHRDGFRVVGIDSWTTDAESSLVLPLPSFTRQTAVSSDANLLATGGIRGPLRLINLRTGGAKELEAAEPWGASGVAFSPDGKILAASSLEGVIRFWNTPTLEVTHTLQGHLIGVNAIAFSPDGTRLASASQGDEAVKLWDVQTGLEVTTLTGEGLIEGGLKFSPDGNLLIGINAQNKAIIWRSPSLGDK